MNKVKSFLKDVYMVVVFSLLSFVLGVLIVRPDAERYKRIYDLYNSCYVEKPTVTKYKAEDLVQYETGYLPVKNAFGKIDKINVEFDNQRKEISYFINGLLVPEKWILNKVVIVKEKE